ncbi:S1 domain-containing protein [Cephalotus follicularis]|uniref:S1 domain-containing protein n=1 Tax=Cephalotus follicularis TaxID=3775 RepID=A0A1Q3BJF7_CEPFO|nr:S1 domain-containing protein [Cephalotus follicularis]
MQTLLQPCKSLSILKYSSSSSPSPLPSLHNFTLICNDAIHNKAYLNKCPLQKRDHFHAYATVIYPKLVYAKRFRFWRSTPLVFCSQNDVFDDFSSTQLPKKLENDRNQDAEELELLSKPSPVPINNGSALKVDEESQKPDEDEVLAPFLRFFKPRNSFEEVEEEGSGLEVNKENNGDSKKEESKKVSVECYEPKPGDCVVGVVVSGNENKLDVNVGADFLGTMLTKEVLPLYDKEMEYLLCDLKRDAEEFMVQGKMGIVKDDNALSGGPAPGAPVVETGTVLFAEVLGRTLSGRPLLSSRRLFRQMSWHRVRQIKELDEPIEVKMTEWNTGGLLTRIEGLRAFLPKVELMKRVNTFTELKENVGRRMYVQITRVNEDNNDLMLSEREAWERLHLQVGTLLEGTVKKIFPYGAQIRISETNRSGLLHISNISRNRITSVSDLLKVDEKVKVLVVKSVFPDKISLSIADLESEPGLFISNKEKVFSEAEEMAKKYRQKLPAISAPKKSTSPPSNALPYENEASLYANWKWFKFEMDDESS